MMTFQVLYDFGVGEAAPGYMKVLQDSFYSMEQGYGFTVGSKVYAKERSGKETLLRDFCIPLEAQFIVDVPNGNYRVTALIGDAVIGTHTTVKSGPGRLMVHELETLAGQFVRQSFSVHVSDGQLQLAFSGLAPRINALEIVYSEQILTMFIAGDSTVTDQPADGYPYAGWGQMLPERLKADIAVSNHAFSGRSSKSFITEGRLEAILRVMKPSDYLLIQFGHNDQKQDEERHTEPFSTYKENLMVYIHEARKREAIPILVTPVHRRYYESDGSIRDTHGDYIKAMKELAAEQNVPVIDLAAKSKALYESLGEEGTKSVFLHAVPGEFRNFPLGAEDNTHFQENGAILISKLVADGLKELQLQPLMMFVK
jgi:lysophospholipase L1-like esterase